MVRSPDGQTTQLTLGSMSIQKAAICLLEQYYKDFSVYNPWLVNSRRCNKQGRKGGVDNENFERTADAVSLRSKKSMKSLVGGNLGANERFYEEYEQERRIRKRKARLFTTTEDAFTHIRRCNGENYESKIMFKN